MKLAPAVVPLCLVALLAGCHGSSTSGLSAADQRAQLDSERAQLDMIPPPSKSRYMAVHDFGSWENPSITVQPSMLELHVLMADANPSPVGVGGMLRPVGARRQELNISFSSLGEAITAIPDGAWPYGRVVAIEEAHKTPANAEPTVRRNLEVVISRLNDLGVVVYDPSSGNLR